MIVSYRRIFLLFSFLFYIFTYFGGKYFFSAASNKDALLIASLEVDTLEIGSSYGVMAYLYSIIPANLIDIVCLTIAIIFIYTVFSDAIKKTNLMILFFLIMIPCILTITSFQKDLILVLFTTPVAFLIKSDFKALSKVLFICFIYLIYAAIFRFYFYLILAIFIGLLIFYFSSIQFKFYLVAIFCSFLSFVPNDTYYQIQSSRDIVNLDRINLISIGNRTAFTNPLYPDSLYNFLYNYFYAAFRLNFGFFFNYGGKDLFFMFYVLTYYFYIFKGILTKNISFVLASLLILSHGLTYFIFEPDSGSYARHLSSTLPYLAIIITGILNQKN